MRSQLEIDLRNLRERLASLDKKIQSQPGSRYLKDVRKSYLRAINSAETTLQIVNDLDPLVLDTMSRLKKTQKVY
jgi:hypothetical protein